MTKEELKERIDSLPFNLRKEKMEKWFSNLVSLDQDSYYPELHKKRILLPDGHSRFSWKEGGYLKKGGLRGYSQEIKMLSVYHRGQLIGKILEEIADFVLVNRMISVEGGDPGPSTKVCHEP